VQFNYSMHEGRPLVTARIPQDEEIYARMGETWIEALEKIVQTLYDELSVQRAINVHNKNIIVEGLRER